MTTQTGRLLQPAAATRSSSRPPSGRRRSSIRNADRPINYGAIGGCIGHEIPTASTTGPPRSTATGVLREWWTAEDAAQVRGARQGAGRPVFGVEPAEGATSTAKLTMGENIADLGGLAAGAGRQYTCRGTGRRRGDQRPNGDQRVFWWAKVWRETSRDESLPSRVTVDPHSPPSTAPPCRERNIDAWYAAFGVEPAKEQYYGAEARARICRHEPDGKGPATLAGAAVVWRMSCFSAAWSRRRGGADGAPATVERVAATTGRRRRRQGRSRRAVPWEPQAASRVSTRRRERTLIHGLITNSWGRKRAVKTKRPGSVPERAAKPPALCRGMLALRVSRRSGRP